ncbi:MAG: response regulator, partial [Nitrospirota bacterium]|nr:response regulator [Nitrospirota bacterium]
ILMDMEMPVMDGYTAARTIRSLMGKKHIPIIAMTAHEGEDEVQQCLRAGCTGYLCKPVTCQSVMKALSEHLKRPETVSHCGQVEAPGKNNVVEIDPDIAELVPRFLRNRKKDTAQISELLAEGNFGDIRVLGHSMAGSAGGYGFPEIGKMGKAIETAALGSQTEDIKKANSMLREYLETVIVVEKKV